MSKSIVALIISLLVACAAVYYGMNQAAASSTTLNNLRKSNDSLTAVLAVTVHHVDSLQRLASREKQLADSFQAVSANASSKIAVVEKQRGNVAHYVKQLPDTGVARTFKDLLH